MKITLSKYAGFCDGVERAFKTVEKIASDSEIKKPVFVLGSLVHNTDVVERIEKLGIRKLKVDNDLFKTLDTMKKKIGTLVITAHGMGPKIYDFCKRKSIDLVDTTCPRVIKVQRLAKIFLDRSNQIVIVGERDHKEVRGIYEWARKKAKFVETEDDLKKLKLDPKGKISVISQTTQNQNFVRKSWKFIREKYPQAEMVDTICLTTQNRQSEIRRMSKENDVIVVIGSPESANSTRLWEIAKEINPRSYFVERSNQIKKSWFGNCGKIGVTAGASTPDWIISGVVKKLESIG